MVKFMDVFGKRNVKTKKEVPTAIYFGMYYGDFGVIVSEKGFMTGYVEKFSYRDSNFRLELFGRKDGIIMRVEFEDDNYVGGYLCGQVVCDQTSYFELVSLLQHHSVDRVGYTSEGLTRAEFAIEMSGDRFSLLENVLSLGEPEKISKEGQFLSLVNVKEETEDENVSAVNRRKANLATGVVKDILVNFL